MSAARRVAACGAAALALTIAGLPGGPWWAAVLAGVPLWPALVRSPPRQAALLAACALAPVPAIGYHGLARLDPWAYAAVIAVVAAGYGLLGAAAAALADACARGGVRCAATEATVAFGRATVLPVAWRPLPWASAWFALDAAAAHGAFGPASLPVTPGYLLVDSPLLPWAAVAGPAALGLAWVVSGVAAASLLPARVGLPGARSWRVAAVATFAMVAVAPWPSPDAGATTRIAVVHSGVVAAAATPDATPDRTPSPIAALERAAAAYERVDLHVWPEMALGPALAAGIAPLDQAARRLDAPILAGAIRFDPIGAERNAAAYADGEGGGFPSEKRRLVPRFEAWAHQGVGERWPLRTAGWRWGVLICWESLLHAEAIDRVRRGADALIVLADGAWARGSWTPWWHARASRVLAVATGRPVVFAATHGPSLAWRHDGARAGFAPADASGALMTVAAAPRGFTPFVRIGLPGMLLGWAIATGAGVFAIRRRAGVLARAARDGTARAGAAR